MRFRRVNGFLCAALYLCNFDEIFSENNGTIDLIIAKVKVWDLCFSNQSDISGRKSSKIRAWKKWPVSKFLLKRTPKNMNFFFAELWAKKSTFFRLKMSFWLFLEIEVQKLPKIPWNILAQLNYILLKWPKIAQTSQFWVLSHGRKKIAMNSRQLIVTVKLHTSTKF